jgi:hypothetical protein
VYLLLGLVILLLLLLLLLWLRRVSAEHASHGMAKGVANGRALQKEASNCHKHIVYRW